MSNPDATAGQPAAAPDMVEIEGQQVSLASIAGIDLEGIAEQRFSSLPRGMYLFEVNSDPMPHLEAIDAKGVKKPAAIMSFIVKDCFGLNDPSEAPKDEATGQSNPLLLIGKTHREVFFLSDEKSIGFCKAFLVDIGCPAKTGALGGLPGKSGKLEACAGLRFRAPIGHRKDPNDADKVYVNIVRGKIIPMGMAPQGAVAAAVATAA